MMYLKFLKKIKKSTMKTLRLILTILSLGAVFASCQKDFSFEGGNAKGTLGKTTAGDCDPINVSGLYYKDTATKPTNFVDVTIDFSKIGIYNIKTDTINGYSFIATGSTGTLGANTIRLYAKGKPIAAGFNIFTVKFDGTQCTFSVQVQMGTGGGGGGGGTTNAVYTFGGAPATCTGTTLGGTYISGVPMLPANNVTLPVNVTAVGPYSITTTANGVTFTGSGMLNTVGVASIILTAAGTPPISTTAVIANYPITSGTSNCSFDVNFAATPAGGAAVFTYTCGLPNINGSYVVNTPTGPTNTVILPVNVTAVGPYSVTIGPVNGVTFSGMGSLPALGAATVTLTASGTATPAAFPFNNYIIPGCTTDLTIPFASGGTLSFINSTGITLNFNYSNIADTAFTNNSPLPNTYDLDFGGQSTLSGSTNTFSLNITKLSPFTAATYTVNQLATGVDFIDVRYINNTGDVFSIASTIAPQTPGFTLIITSITPTRVMGIFSGKLTAVSPATGTYDIVGGQFNLPLQ